MNLDRGIIDAWIDSLESGLHKTCKFTLCREEDGERAYCPLGLLLLLVEPEGYDAHPSEDGVVLHKGVDGWLSSPAISGFVQRELGVPSPVISSLNDNGAPSSLIAALIRAMVERNAEKKGDALVTRATVGDDSAAVYAFSSFWVTEINGRIYECKA